VDEEAPPNTYDSLSLALAILRAFANGDRDEGIRLVQLLSDESANSLRALDEVAANTGSAVLPIAGPTRDIDIDATLSELAVRMAKRFDEIAPSEDEASEGESPPN